MPRLSLWKDGKHTNDYKFFDRRISELFTIGGTGIHVHKYLGPQPQGQTGDATKPSFINQSEKNIQDLLFLENRDRKYDTSVYNLRGIYTVSDNDFDLTQFGLFLQTGTLFITFHINDMVQTLGRKLMNGDVLELMHLVDYETLDTSLPAALKRYFVITDCTRASQGFSPTWWPHLWRCKINPLVDSQEYKDILKNINAQGEDSEQFTPLKDLLSTYDQYTQINDAVIEQAENEVPKSGYDVDYLYHQPKEDEPTADYKIKGHLTGTGEPPNGESVVSGIRFPANPKLGDFCLRVDFKPNRLFRFDGRRWIKIENERRTNITSGDDDNKTLRNSFVNNPNTFVDMNQNVHDEKQNLHEVLRPRSDYK